MNAPVKAVVIDRDELDSRICASLVRVLGMCPIEKNPRVFEMLAGVVAENLADRRRQHVDDLVAVAEEQGLIRLVGQFKVMEAIRTALSRVGL